ncbi:GSDA3 protein, partial [Loxia curvirostra]|nr:GSDA3 protein [Loxia curvirostra]
PFAFLQNFSHRMFKKLTKFIVNQMDPSQDLDPVESIADNEHFRPLCLLTKKRKPKRIFHRAPYYQRTGFTLDDVLLPGEDDKSIESLHQESSQFTLTKTSADQVEGHASAPLGPVSAEVGGGASSLNVFSITLQKKSIPLQSLEALRRERQININHSLIQQLQRTNINLYMVTEILEASEETIYKASIMADGVFNVMCHITLGAQGTRENNQSIVIPKGCTLAFRTIPLYIRHREWKFANLSEVEAIPSCAIGFKLDQAETCCELEFGLKEVEIHCQIFSELSPDLLLIILNTIKAVMRDKNLLQELSQKVSEAFLTATIYKYRHIHKHTSCLTSHLPCATTVHPKFLLSAHLPALDKQQPLPSNPNISCPCSPQMEEVAEQNDGYQLNTESPDLKDLFNILQHSPGGHLLLLAEGITYVLDALQ